MAQKTGIPKGTRDFTPTEIARRNYILSTIRKQFELFGYLPIETPAFENLDTLMGKYGEEGDRLIFKILNSGDYLAKVSEDQLKDRNSKGLTRSISEKALRYDLTVPFARYVVMHQNEIDLPFKRYQIQPVWRADRPQKGRFREFYQCDADVVGSTSLLQEVELLQLYDTVFADLGMKNISLKLNHRQILTGIAQVIGAGDQITAFTTALDKLDKIGVDGVKAEMKSKGISDETLKKADPLFSLSGSNAAVLESLKKILANNEEGEAGITAIETILEKLENLGLSVCDIVLDITLARGLNYYTGTIMEVSPPAGVSMGSIGGGGRYDDLTGIFGMKGTSGVGISFGLERIYLVMDELKLFPESLKRELDVLCLNFGEQEATAALKLVKSLREAGIKSDLYPSSAKIQKQMKYANNRNVPFVVLLGEQELQDNTFVVKNMMTGEQSSYKLEEIGDFTASL